MHSFCTRQNGNVSSKFLIVSVVVAVCLCAAILAQVSEVLASSFEKSSSAARGSFATTGYSRGRSTRSGSPTPKPTISASPIATPTNSPTATVTLTTTPTPTVTATITATVTATVTSTPNASQTPTPSGTASPVSSPKVTPTPTASVTPTTSAQFLVPPDGQTLYSGTSYQVVAQASGAPSVSVADQTGATLPCTFTSSNGLLTCKYAPSTAGTAVLTLAGYGSSVSRHFTVLQPNGIYPQGDKMMVGAYDGFDDASAAVFTNYARDGFNFSQLYCSNCSTSDMTSFADAVHSAGMAGAAGYLFNNNCFSPLGSANGGVAGCESQIVSLIPDANILFWGLPEENYVTNYLADDAQLYAFVKAKDKANRPVFKYWVSGMTYDSLEPTVANVDLVAEGAYPIDDGCGWQGSAYPDVFARWVVEQEIEAITSAGYTVGPNYIAGQKTPILVPETVTANTYCTASATSGADITNQIWNGLAAGAAGYIDYLWEDTVVVGGLTDVASAMANINVLLVGSEGVGEWMLKGSRQSDLATTVLTGPAGSVGVSGTRTFSYAPIRAAVWDWAGTRLIVAINSSPSAITAKISGLPTGMPSATVVAENRTVSTASGAISDSFHGLGVHIYKIPLVSQQSGGGWMALP